MTAARYLARRSRTFVASVTLLALFTAGIATAMAAGGGTGSAKAKDGYSVVHSRNPQTRVNRLLHEEPGGCEAVLTDAQIEVRGSGVAVASFTIGDGCAGVLVGLVSYSTPKAGFSLPQHQFALAHGLFDAGTHELEVGLPPCAGDGEEGFQVDLLVGAATPPGTVTSDNLFHVAAAVNGGLPSCHPATTTGEEDTTESTSTDWHPTSTDSESTTTETHPTTSTTTTETHPTTSTTTTTETHPTTTTTPTTTTHPPTTTSTPTTATTTTTTPTTVDVSITKLANVSTAFVGDQITYALTIHNNGPATATNVTVVDDLPAEVTFVSSSPSQGSCTGTDPVRCTLGTLASGATATVTIVVRATSAGTALNGSSVSSTEPDTNTANNVAQAIVAIGAFTPPTCRSLSLVVSPQRVIVGRPITIVANVRDQNGDGVAGVRVTIRGGGVTTAKSTDSRGRATFHFTPTRTGALQASIPAIASCASGAVSGVVHVRGAFRPPRPKVTG